MYKRFTFLAFENDVHRQMKLPPEFGGILRNFVEFCEILRTSDARLAAFGRSNTTSRGYSSSLGGLRPFEHY